MGIFSRFQKQLNMEDPKQLRKECGWLWSRVKKHRGAVLAVGALALLGTVMSLASSLASKYLIDAVTGFGTDRIGGAALWMAAMMLGGLLLQAVSSRVGARVHVRVRNRLQYKIYGRILRARWENTDTYRSGELLNRLNSDINIVSDGVISFGPSLIASAVQFAGAFVIIFFFDPVMALIALCCAPVTLLASHYLMKRLRKHDLAMKESVGEVMSFQEDSLRNLTSIKAFDAVKRYRHEMGKVQDQYAEAYLSFNSFRISVNTLLSLVSMVVTSACFGWGVYQLWAGKITYGSMTMFLQLAGVLRSTFSSLVSLAQQGISLTTSAGRIMALEDLPRENDVVCEGLDQENRVNIQLKQVSFHYQNGDTLLHPFDFCACDGDQVAIMGPSGEGKTTLLRILLGLVEPCSGTAELIGDTGTVYPINAGTRNRFAYVPQENSIFTGTIAHNLRIVAPEATEEEMVEALKVACAWEFVQQLPEGLNHPLSTGGRGVSEGQAQRLAIARALLRKAPVLLLDEATSGLDVATERRLMENLRRSGMVRTCILVTHRPASAEFCNRAYEIHDGQISEVSHGA
jgi:ABC-type bacteriocin/lantibiotic exporter with double-glycine peptidase domain